MRTTVTATTDTLTLIASSPGAEVPVLVRLQVEPGDLAGVVALQEKDAYAPDADYVTITTLTTFSTEIVTAVTTQVFGQKAFRMNPTTVTSGSAEVTLEPNL